MEDVCPEVCDDQIEWYRDELLLLQDELDTTQDELQETTENLRKATDKVAKLKWDMRTIKQDTIDSINEKNTDITTRMLALSDVVDEYDKVLNKYVALTNTKLVTTKLNELRSKGGYLPL